MYRSSFRSEDGDHLRPNASFAPFVIARIHRVPGSKAGRNLPPRRTSPHDPQNACQKVPFRIRPPSRSRLAGWEQGCDLLPPLVCQRADPWQHAGLTAGRWWQGQAPDSIALSRLAALGMAPFGGRLMLAPPARPLLPMLSLVFGLCQPVLQAPHFRYGEGYQVGWGVGGGWACQRTRLDRH